MNCDEIRPLLDAFAEGELESPRQQTVEEHLKQCLSCQKELSAIRRTVRLLTEFGEVDEPADFAQQVRQRIETRRTRHILDRLLPRRPLTRMLAGATCLILAGFGVWLAVRQFLPSERMQKYRAEEDSEPIRIASIPKDEKEFLSRTPEKPSETDFKRGGRADVWSKGVGSKNADDLGRSAADRTKAPTAPTETSGTQLTRLFVAKSSPTEAGSELHARQAAEEQPLPTGDKLKTEERLAEVHDVETQMWALRSAATPEDVLAKTLPEEGEAKEATATRGRAADEKDITERRLATAIGKHLAWEETPTIEIESYGKKEILPETAKKEGELAKYRSRERSEAKVTADDIDSDGGEFRREGEETLPGKVLHARRSVKALEPLQNGRGPDHSTVDFAYDGESITGDIEHQEGIMGQTESQRLSTSPQRGLLIGVDDFAAGYRYFREATPKLVLYVKDRQKAMHEIERVVADFDGTIDPAVSEEGKASLALGVQEASSFVVKLKSSAYSTFLKKLLARPISAGVESGAGQLTIRRGASEDVQPKDTTTTLVIRLIEIRQQDQPQEPAGK